MVTAAAARHHAWDRCTPPKLGRTPFRMFADPAINIDSRDLVRLVSFYEGLGFRETFRTPEDGTRFMSRSSSTGSRSGSRRSGRRSPTMGWTRASTAGPWRSCSGPTTQTATTRALDRRRRSLAQRAARLPVRSPPRLGRRPGRQSDPTRSEARTDGVDSG